jgi:hypothetical protein
LIFCSLAAFGESNPYYAGNENPLVRLGAQRIWKGIDYPAWFQYPGIRRDVREQLVDSYTTREFLSSFDESANAAPATKWNNAAQLLLDLGDGMGAALELELPSSPTRKEINETFRKKIVPELVKQRDKTLDSPSDHETDTNGYDGLNGDYIKALDRNMAILARQYNIPTGYQPPSSSMSPSERDAWQRNTEKVARETLPPAAQAPLMLERRLITINVLLTLRKRRVAVLKFVQMRLNPVVGLQRRTATCARRTRTRHTVTNS